MGKEVQFLGKKLSYWVKEFSLHNELTPSNFLFYGFKKNTPVHAKLVEIKMTIFPGIQVCMFYISVIV